jgi:3'(2'), 5'-bisphosphate nucleotidase
MTPSDIELNDLGQLARQAGEAILKIYATEFQVETKKDQSPLTLADTRSNTIITQGLNSRYPDIPVISEEGKSISYALRKKWPRFWLVDPLDGTKEFIKKNDEFTVNIALIENHLPILGVVYVPAKDALYLGEVNKDCRRVAHGVETALQIQASTPSGPVRIVQSRSHPSAELDAFIRRMPDNLSVYRGSSLKFCSVAEGEADIYPRLAPTWEWDTAAGQAVVTAAGGVVVDLNKNALAYNKETLLNGHFIALDPASPISVKSERFQLKSNCQTTKLWSRSGKRIPPKVLTPGYWLSASH